jgi:hypothetical protein
MDATLLTLPKPPSLSINKPSTKNRKTKIMTPERAKELLPVIQAFAEGKEIEMRTHPNNAWMPVAEASWLNSIEYRIKPEPPWTLSRQIPGFRPLSEGEEWFNGDKFTKDMLPDGYRPLLVGEKKSSGDGYLEDGDRWEMIKSVFGDLYPGVLYRTTRPLPKPKKRVPLEPEDVPLGSVFTHNSVQQHLFWQPITVIGTGVLFAELAMGEDKGFIQEKNWDSLMRSWKIKRPGTTEFVPCWKEVEEEGV